MTLISRATHRTCAVDGTGAPGHRLYELALGEIEIDVLF